MADTNIVVLSGYVGGDAEVRPAGSSYVMQFSLGVSRPRKMATGQWDSDTKWVKVAQWFNEREKADNAAERIKKGCKVIVNGRLEEPEVWVGKDGKPHASLRITVKEFVTVVLPPKDSTEGVPTVDDSDDLPF